MKDANVSVQIHPHSQKYIRFCWKTRTHQFKALPFRLIIAPVDIHPVNESRIELPTEVRCPNSNLPRQYVHYWEQGLVHLLTDNNLFHNQFKHTDDFAVLTEEKLEKLQTLCCQALIIGKP